MTVFSVTHVAADGDHRFSKPLHAVIRLVGGEVAPGDPIDVARPPEPYVALERV